MAPQERRLRLTVAVNVRRLREEQGMTLEDAASAANTSARNWQKIEAGAVGLTLRMVGKLAAALDIDPLTLFARN